MVDEEYYPEDGDGPLGSDTLSLESYHRLFLQPGSSKAIWQVIRVEDTSLVQLYNVFLSSFLYQRTDGGLGLTTQASDQTTHFRARFYSRRGAQRWRIEEDAVCFETLDGLALGCEGAKKQVLGATDCSMYTMELGKRREARSHWRLQQASFQKVRDCYFLGCYAGFLRSSMEHADLSPELLEKVEQCLHNLHAYLFRELKGGVDYERIYDETFQSQQDTLLEFGFFSIFLSVLDRLASEEAAHQLPG